MTDQDKAFDWKRIRHLLKNLLQLTRDRTDRQSRCSFSMDLSKYIEDKSIVCHCDQSYEEILSCPIHNDCKELPSVDCENHKLYTSRYLQRAVYDGHKQSRWDVFLGLSKYISRRSNFVPWKNSLPLLPFVG